MASLLRNQLQNSPNLRRNGFALPTILIASIVMLTVLLVSVTSTTAIRTAMFNQYYSQLAQAAGEAGVEYAKACLQASANVPAWTNAKPLMPNTDCSGNVQAGYPAYVMTSGNVRSGFSLSAPTLDSNGKAKTLPNSGYVEITRTSNGEVWRRYDQPSVQAAVVPDLCSGTATSSLGWANATVRTSSYGPSTADPISVSTVNIKPGPMYFRKDFTIVEDANYTFSIYANDIAEVFIDDSLLIKFDRAVNGTSTITAPVSLSSGCHTLMVKFTNNEILDNSSVLVASLAQNGASTPVVITDSSWRVAAGGQKHYSTVDYYADPASWTAVRNIAFANTIDGGWGPASGDYGTRWISTAHSYDGSGNYPTGQFTLFRDNRTIEIPLATTAKVTLRCDDSCYPYLDGNLIHQGIPNVAPISFTVSLTEGLHKFAFLAGNNSAGAGYALSVTDVATGALITHTDDNWSAANFWSAANPTNSYSYDNSYKPNPNPMPESNVSILAVGGGGGGGGFGGGAGAGGFVYKNAYSIGLGSHPVVVGAGGAGAVTNAGLPGNNGGSSVFETIIAVGGGGGGTRNADNTSNVGASGGSGGGSSMGNAGTIGPAGIGILGQGMAGGLGRIGTAPHLHGGGGGAGGVGGNAVAPNAGAGGAGLASSITGASVYYAGGGGGGTYTDGTYVVGPGGIGGGGAGQSIVNANGGAGTPNTGGGGGGSGYGGYGGGGGSGVVIIRYPAGSMTATGGTITTSGGYTIHRFTSSGTFTVTSIL